jgi:hypothetical protein
MCEGDSGVIHTEPLNVIWGIVALVLHHGEQAVMTAVDLALAERLPTKTHTLHILHRLLDIKVIGGPPLDTPQALTLRRDSEALRACGVRVSATADPRQALPWHGSSPAPLACGGRSAAYR